MIDQERIQRILRPVLMGFDAEQRDSLERAFEAIVGEVSTAAKGDAEPSVRIDPIIQANPRSYLRLKPPPLGQSLQLPAPRRCQAGDFVEVSIEAPEGVLRVTALPHDEGAVRITSTVNGLEFATYAVSGFVRFVTNGDDRWSSHTEFPAESAAAQRIAAGAAPGATGADGTEGDQGPPGRDGAPGMRGERGYPGQPGPIGADGRQGPPGAAGRWALPPPIIPGAPGTPGLQGTPGMPGGRGHPGNRGYPGQKGDKGDKGDQGPPGRDGRPGPAGSPGPAGRQGETGATGATGTGAAAWAALEESGAGPFDDFARASDARDLMFTNAAGTLRGIAAAAADGDMLVVDHQGTGFTDVTDNAGTSAAGNRIHNYADKTLRLLDDDLALFVSVPITSTGTATPSNPRWRCVTHRYPFANVSGNAAGDAIVHNGTDWVHVAGGNNADVALRGNATFGTLANAALADMSETRIKGRSIGSGTGPPQDLTGAAIAAILGQDAPCILQVSYAGSADASYSITPPSGATWYEVEGCAGGGGGGGADPETAIRGCAGGGGGAGAGFKFRGAIISGAMTGAIGDGGTAGANTGGNGGAGGATTFNYGAGAVAISAGGGTGGTGSTNATAAVASTSKAFSGGIGGAVAGATEAFNGADGGNGWVIMAATAANSSCVSGYGAPSMYGGGGRGIPINGIASAAGENSSTPGSGGSGGSKITNTTAAATGVAGAGGIPGQLRVTFYSGPVPTFAAIT